jgi:hypothetical protein
VLVGKATRNGPSPLGGPPTLQNGDSFCTQWNSAERDKCAARSSEHKLTNCSWQKSCWLITFANILAYFVRSLGTRSLPPYSESDAIALMDTTFTFLNMRRTVTSGTTSTDDRNPLLGLDFKYNELRFITPVFRDLRQPPFLLDYFRLRDVRVVDMVRRSDSARYLRCYSPIHGSCGTTGNIKSLSNIAWNYPVIAPREMGCRAEQKAQRTVRWSQHCGMCI